MSLGYGWVCAVLEVSPCQCRQYTNAEATWAYAGCNFVGFKQLEAAEKDNVCAEHGHYNQPGPAHKGGYSPHPAVGPNFAATGPDAHTLQILALMDNMHARRVTEAASAAT